MAEVKWIKITTTMFDDEKIKLIEKLPDADSILIIWIKLLTLAGKCNAGGYIFLSETIPYTDEMIATIFDRPLNTVRLALQTFQNFGMIESDQKGICLTNWEKHQNIEGLDRIREQNRARFKRHYEKKKQEKLLLENTNSNVSIMLPNATDKIRIDKEENRDNNIRHLSFDEFWQLYPKKVEKKKAQEKYNKALSAGIEHSTIMAGLKQYVKHIKDTKKEVQFIKHPTTWLNGECWNDSHEQSDKSWRRR